MATTIADKIAELQTRRAAYITAEAEILIGGQSMSIGNRSLDRGRLEEIRKAIKEIDSMLQALSNGNRIRIQRVVPRDGI